MSFLADLFKKKDAAFYLAKARKALDRELWVDARDLAEDGLSKSPSSELEHELGQVAREARRAICDMNRQEAQYSADAGELERATDLLEVAMENAPTEAVRREIRRELDRLERRAVSRDRTRVAQDLERRPSIGQQTISPLLGGGGPAHDVRDLFEVYLAGLVPEVAEQYRALGEDFMEAYVSLNQGDIKQALTLLRKVDPPEDARPYLSFERARVALDLDMVREALSLIEATAAAHGYGPLYLSGSPSIAQVEAEARLRMDDVAGAVKAVRKGLEADETNNHLRTLEIQLLIRQGAFEEAIGNIDRGLAASPKARELYLLRYQLEMQRNDPASAAAALERGMSRCCANGACGAADRELPRGLISHYLRREEKPKRIEELLQQLFMSQGGEGEWIDLYLRARYYKWQGDDTRGHKNWEAALHALPEDHPSYAEVRSLYAPA